MMDGEEVVIKGGARTPQRAFWLFFFPAHAPPPPPPSPFLPMPSYKAQDHRTFGSLIGIAS